MARAVGLDIGTRTIKVVELSGTPKAFKVVRVVTRPIPTPEPQAAEGEIPKGQEELTSEVIREIFDSMKLPRDDVCAAFSSGATVFREIQVPFLEDDQIRKVVKFEAENHLHSHAIEDVVVNWVKTGESRDGSRLTVFASPKVELQRLLEILAGAGISPASVDLDATALFTAYQASGVFEENPNVIVIDVGARSTTLLLVVEGRPVVLRSFLLGTNQVETGLSRELDVPLTEGRRRARLPGGPHPDDLIVPVASLTPPAEDTDKSLEQLRGDMADELRGTFVRKLHREAMRSLASLRQETTPERILLSGGGSLLPGLASALQERFELPVTRIDLGAHVDWKDQGPEPEVTQAVTPAAVGCGLRMLGHNPLGVELLRDEFAPTNRFDVIKGALATFVTLLFVALLALAFVASERRRAEQNRYRFIAGRASSLFQRAELDYRLDVLGQTEDLAKNEIRRWMGRNAEPEYRQVDEFQGRLKERLIELEKKLGKGDYPEIRSALKVWLEMYRALNKKPRGDYGRWLRILKMDIGQLRATLRFEVDDQASFDRVRQQFEDSPYFREQARNNTRVVEPKAASFEKGHWRRDFEFRFKEPE